MPINPVPLRAATALGSVAALILVGCSQLGSQTASWTGLKNKSGSYAATLGAVQTDEMGRPVPGSKPVPPPVIEEHKSTVSAQTRGHVALAMGELFEGNGNLAEAQARYEQALKADPKSLKAALALARVYARQGRPEAALEVYETAEKQHRRSAAVYNDKGLLLADQKDWSQAIAALRTAVRLDPKESKYHNNLGMILAASGAHEEAWKEFREAVGAGPAHYNVALMLLRAGCTAEARSHLEQALVAMPGLREAEALLAQTNPDRPANQPVSPEPESETDLPVVGKLTVDAVPPEAADDPGISPAAASEPVNSTEPDEESASPATAPDASRRQWIPPRWLR